MVGLLFLATTTTTTTTTNAATSFEPHIYLQQQHQHQQHKAPNPYVLSSSSSSSSSPSEAASLLPTTTTAQQESTPTIPTPPPPDNNNLVLDICCKAAFGWAEWKDCLQEKSDSVFDDFITNNNIDPTLFPWNHANPALKNYTAILLEFRPWETELTFFLNNALDNLPLHWRVQVIGGPAIIALTKRLFPLEVQVGKIVVTSLKGSKSGRDHVPDYEISQVLTDLAFYDQLLGDTWLFFQYDSAICSPQRHLLEDYFLTKNYGWWGAPWRQWDHQLQFGGNGGFSLRKRDFVTAILKRFPWVSQEESGNEDIYIILKALDLYNKHKAQYPRGQQVQRPPPYPPGIPSWPAPFVEEIRFSVESIPYPKPYGVHKYWAMYSSSYDVPSLRTLFENCPEALQILPLSVIRTRPLWRTAACEVLESGKITVTSFDYEEECFLEPAGEMQEEKKRKRRRKLMRKMRRKAKRAQRGEEEADIMMSLGE